MQNFSGGKSLSGGSWRMHGKKQNEKEVISPKRRSPTFPIAVRKVDQTHDLGNTMLDAAIETAATQE
jgi:hypothetical protein